MCMTNTEGQKVTAVCPINPGPRIQRFVTSADSGVWGKEQRFNTRTAFFRTIQIKYDYDLGIVLQIIFCCLRTLKNVNDRVSCYLHQRFAF